VTRAATFPRPGIPLALRRVPWHVVRDGARAVASAADGILAGLIVGYIAGTAVTAPSHHLGLALPLDVLLVAMLTTTLTLAGGWVARAIGVVIRWLGRRAVGALTHRGHDRAAAVVGIPLRIVGALPLGLLGGFGVLLWIGTTGRTIGPLGLLTPGILSPYVFVVGATGGMLALAWAVLHRRDRTAPGTARRGIAVLAVIAALTLSIAALTVALEPGTTAGLAAHDPRLDGEVMRSGLDDPGGRGPYAVERWSYGTGRDLRRAAFGIEADRITPPVDASRVLPRLGGGADEVRRWFWGFGPEALPLDGLVWMPRGDGPFPLVLIVHGNHPMGDFSEDGYAYLADHLASRGFIAVSIDEDFLNGSWVGEWHGTEQLVRAWLLLLHLDQWRAWEADAATGLQGRVDLGRIALVGHSRGGEASSVAASLADDARPPSPAIDRWPTGLEIDAVVSIAPSDGQYDSGTRLEGVDFLTIQGGHDADARAWSGIRQYARTAVAGDGFKAGLWVYRANHGQFNTVWGRGDFGPHTGTLIDLAPLLSPAEQQDVARTAIGAFLEASLHDRAAYRGFFRRPMVGQGWLPEDIVVVRSVGGDLVPLTDGDPHRFVDGIDEKTAGVASLHSIALPLRALQEDQGMRALVVGWDGVERMASWGLTGLDRVGATIASATELRFALADATAASDGTGEPLTVWVEVTSRSGVTAALPLDRVGAPPPLLPVDFPKNDLLMAVSPVDVALRSPEERVMQTYAIPLSTFEALEPEFQAEEIEGFRLRFETMSPGAVWIAEVGLGG
jgi:dienelactone hydrolase